VTTTCEPTAGSTYATSRANASDDDPIVLFCRFVGFKPLYTGSEGEH